jgi:hypothetical protein
MAKNLVFDVRMHAGDNKLCRARMAAGIGRHVGYIHPLPGKTLSRANNAIAKLATALRRDCVRLPPECPKHFLDAIFPG